MSSDNSTSPKDKRDAYTSEGEHAPSGESFTANDDFDTGLRLGIASALGQTGFNSLDDDNPRRNHFEVFGWPKDDLDNWGDDEWIALYLRNGYAQTVNDKLAEVAWRDEPTVSDTDEGEDDSEFEAAVSRAAENLNLWSYCNRTDKVAGLGQHGLLVMGLSDVANADEDKWQEPATEQSYSGLDDVDTLKPVLETQIEEIEWGGPEDGDRWGKPVEYQIDFSDDIDDETEDDVGYRHVHWTRVIDVPAQVPLDDETLSRPRAEPCLNNLLDIEKTLGATAEAAFMSANSDIWMNADPTQVDMSQGSDEIRDELMRYFEGQPFLRTQGMDVEQLDGQVQDPSGIVEANLDEIAAVTGIPKSSLRGNQSGEVSGAEKDERDLFGTAEQRREQYVEPFLVRAVLDRWIELNILPTPQNGRYDVEFPDLFQRTEKEIADTQSTRAQVIAQAGPAIGLTGERAETYIQTGEIPERETTAPPMETEQVQNQFNRQFGITANQDMDLTPPDAAQENAQKVLRWREEHPDEIEGMTDVGWRRAEKLASGGELSPEVVKKMAQFNRHRGNAPVADEFEGTPWRDAGHVAWNGWGGDAGVDWAIQKSEELTDE